MPVNRVYPLAVAQPFNQTDWNIPWIQKKRAISIIFYSPYSSRSGPCTHLLIWATCSRFYLFILSTRALGKRFSFTFLPFFHSLYERLCSLLKNIRFPASIILFIYINRLFIFFWLFLFLLFSSVLLDSVPVSSYFFNYLVIRFYNNLK